MQANTVQKRLDSLSALSQAGKRVNGLARLLASGVLHHYAVTRTRKNLGSSTPGIDGETLDGLTIERINGWVHGMVEGKYRTSPVLRAYIPKANGKLRPLGIPTYADRMLQDGQRDVLQKIYEPVFSDHSHGFRPGRSCHTALMQVQRYWTAVKWFVEVDIKGYFDNINHETPLNLLRKRIDDEAFIATIRAQLEAGVMEDMAGDKGKARKGGARKRRMEFRRTYSGTPQGGIVSPILANIYLHELDEFMQAEILAFNQGERRRPNPPYTRVKEVISYRRKKIKELGDTETDKAKRNDLITETKELTQKMRALPSKDPMDPDYRRLRYVRYADDFLIGVTGSKAEAVAVLDRVRSFLKDTLHLDVSEEKTRMVKATDGVKFLGYNIFTKTGVRIAPYKMEDFVATKRSSSERIILSVPKEKLLEFCNRHGYGDYLIAKGRHRDELYRSSDREIVSIYNAELRGFANYYRLDTRIKSRISQLAWVANQSLMQTLAFRHRTSTGAILKRLRQPDGSDVVRHDGGNGKILTISVWKPKDIGKVGKASKVAEIDKEPLGNKLALARTDVTDRLLAGECENSLCTSPRGTPLQVHHVRAMANVKDSPFVEWIASARSRKTRYLCIHCHPKVRTNAKDRRIKHANGEPDDGKLSRPVLETNHRGRPDG